MRALKRPPPCVVNVVVCDEVNEEDAVHQVDKVDEVHQVHQVDLAHQVNKVDEVHQVHPLDPVHQNTSEISNKNDRSDCRPF